MILAAALHRVGEGHELVVGRRRRPRRRRPGGRWRRRLAWPWRRRPASRPRPAELGGERVEQGADQLGANPVLAVAAVGADVAADGGAQPPLVVAAPGEATGERLDQRVAEGAARRRRARRRGLGGGGGRGWCRPRWRRPLLPATGGR